MNVRKKYNIITTTSASADDIRENKTAYIKINGNIEKIFGTIANYNGLLVFKNNPTITLEDSTLKITALKGATSYDIYSNNVLLENTSALEIDLTTLLTEKGTYSIYAIAKDSEYKDSGKSNEVSYEVLPKLSTPSISFNKVEEDRLDVSGNSSASYDIYSNGSLLATASMDNLLLSKFITAVGTYNIYIIGKKSGYRDSDASNTLSYVVTEMPKKGALINLDMTGSGTTSQYRVLKVDGTVAEVLGMSNLATKAYNATSKTGTFDGGTTGQLYANSDLDNYLNITWYNTLSSTAKNALVQKNIIQKMYSISTSDPGNSICKGWYPYDTYYLALADQRTVGNRYIYALDVEDIVKYLGTYIYHLNIRRMYWNSDSWVNDYIWLNSASPHHSTSRVFSVWGTKQACITSNSCDTTYYCVRSAFQIDLSKITWSRVS